MLTGRPFRAGAYATWLSSLEGAEGAALSGECMRAAGAALQRCPAPAALALRKLCVDCTAPAAALVADIVQVAQVSSVSRCDLSLIIYAY